MSEIAKPSDPMKEFRERVAAKLRDDIGAMLPDEALEEMVRVAVRDQFFKPIIITDTYKRDEIKPSWFVTEVTKVAEPIIKKTIEQYVATHHEVIEKAVAEFLSDKHLAMLAFAALRDATHKDFFSMAQEIANSINNR